MKKIKNQIMKILDESGIECANSIEYGTCNGALIWFKVLDSKRRLLLVNDNGKTEQIIRYCDEMNMVIIKNLVTGLITSTVYNKLNLKTFTSIYIISNDEKISGMLKEDKNVVSRTTYKYNRNRKVKWSQQISNFNTITTKYIYEGNKLIKEIEETEYKLEKEICKNTIKVRILEYFEDTDILKRDYTTVNDKMKSEILFNEKGEILHFLDNYYIQRDYLYKNNLLSAIVVSNKETGKILQVSDYEYNKNANQICDNAHIDGRNYCNYYEYDDQNRRTIMISYAEGKWLSTIYYEYYIINGNNIIKQTERRDKGFISIIILSNNKYLSQLTHFFDNIKPSMVFTGYDENGREIQRIEDGKIEILEYNTIKL